MQVRPCVVDASEDQGSANLSLIPADRESEVLKCLETEEKTACS
jgi:hypothetical protein